MVLVPEAEPSGPGSTEEGCDQSEGESSMELTSAESGSSPDDAYAGFMRISLREKNSETTASMDRVRKSCSFGGWNMELR